MQINAHAVSLHRWSQGDADALNAADGNFWYDSAQVITPKPSERAFRACQRPEGQAGYPLDYLEHLLSREADLCGYLSGISIEPWRYRGEGQGM